LGPVFVGVRKAEGRFEARPQLSAVAAAAMFAGLSEARLRDDMSIDWGRTLGTGMLVLRGSGARLPGEEYVWGRAVAGTLRYAAHSDAPGGIAQVMAHELMHATQFHRDVILQALPAMDRLRSSGLGERLGTPDWLLLDGVLPLVGLNGLSHLTGTGLRGDLWWEREADAMIGVSWCATHPSVRPCW
jgi:hypothetical protein